MRFALSILIALTLIVPAFAEGTAISGSWTYRSFHNRPNVMVGDDDSTAAETALSLIFGEGVVTLAVDESGAATGALDLGPNYALDLAGTASCGGETGPVTVTLTGTGRAGTPTAGWEYKYVGYLAHTWEQGVRQVPALVGTVLRSKQHGNALPGYSTSFIAVKRPAGAN
jgi:hypothetical protein